MKSKGVGSHPGTYVALQMPSTSMMPAMEHMLNDLRGAPAAATLVQALTSHAQAVHLTRNPRFAACLLKRLVDFCEQRVGIGYDELVPTAEAARSLVDMHLFAAARDYKDLNAMQMASRDDVALCYTHAIEMLLRKAQDEKPLGTLEFLLLSKIGVLTDCAFWAAKVPVGHVAVDGARIEEKNRQGEIVSLILV
ncbi:Hypothetical protein, putative, partial [Bodo saltans]